MGLGNSPQCRPNARQSPRAGTGTARVVRCRARTHKGPVQAQHKTLAGTGYGPRHTGIPAHKQVFMGFRNSPQLSMSTECIAPHTRRGGNSTRQQVQGTHAPMARASMCRARAHAVCGFGSTFGFAWQGKNKANNAQPPCQR